MRLRMVEADPDHVKRPYWDLLESGVEILP